MEPQPRGRPARARPQTRPPAMSSSKTVPHSVPKSAAPAPTRATLPEQPISREVLVEKYAKGDERSVDEVRRRVARALAHREQAGNPAPELPADAPHTIIVGCGRVGRVVADLLRAHGHPFIGVDSDPDLITLSVERGYPAIYGDAARIETLARLGVDKASAVVLTMDEPVAAQRLVKRLRSHYPQLPIIARARDSAHAAQLYRAGATHAVPEALEASLQLGESLLVELGVPMGFVIATIHEKRDTFRDKIMREGGLDQKPRLKSSSLRDRAG